MDFVLDIDRDCLECFPKRLFGYNRVSIVLTCFVGVFFNVEKFIDIKWY